MLRYLVRRVLGSIPVLLVASFLTFWLVRVAVDPLAKFRHLRELGASASPQQRKELGLDHPIVVQWWNWFTKFVRGDLGMSDRTHDPVSGDDQARAVADAAADVLGDASCSVILAIVLGVYSAVKQYSVGDYVFTGLSYIGIAMPTSGSGCSRSRCS